MINFCDCQIYFDLRNNIVNKLTKLTLISSAFLLSREGISQTCFDDIKPSWPETRYTLQNEEVFDNLTQLIWKRCSQGQEWDSEAATCTGSAVTYNWASALGLADGKWRVPNIKELGSLVEVACYSPAINLSVYPETPSGFYWSSSPYIAYAAPIYDNSNAWFINFNRGGFQLNGTYPVSRYVRLVRGG